MDCFGLFVELWLSWSKAHMGCFGCCLAIVNYKDFRKIDQ